MALSTSAPAPYAPAAAILGLLERNRSRGLPTPIDKEVLSRSGISDSLVSRTLQALHALDLIHEDGTHTETFEGLRLAPEGEYKSKMAEWLNAAYADVIQFVDPSKGDEVAVRDALRPYKPFSMQDRMMTLFTGLYGAAGIWPEGAQKARVRPLHVLAQRQATAVGNNIQKPKQKAKPPEPNPPVEVTEKALEYRLVDLMGDATGDDEVVQAIIKVITFLKVRNTDSNSRK